MPKGNDPGLSMDQAIKSLEQAVDVLKQLRSHGSNPELLGLARAFVTRANTALRFAVSRERATFDKAAEAQEAQETEEIEA